ncbi:hypothetical protein MUK42_06003 [Musa troglodytarum]|uniref:Uncharacterized protein n=1 Tax=Musa troglodytarum TaxID=320322 RepID=A0A9E7KDE2_9LILI|nr:hypothetical protein MUK42_06003 [Musa troglodytarum]
MTRLPLSGIEAILSNDDLQVASEDAIYDFALKCWTSLTSLGKVIRLQNEPKVYRMGRRMTSHCHHINASVFILLWFVASEI